VAPASALSSAAAPESTRKLGLIGTAAALLIVLAIGAYFGYRMLAGAGEEKKATAIVEPPKSEAPPPTATSEPAKEAAPPAAAETPPVTASAGQETPQSSATATLPGAPAVPATGSPSAALHGMPAVGGDTAQEPGAARKAAAKAQPKAGVESAVAGLEGPSKTGAPAPAKAPAAKAAAVAVAPAPPQPDRWQMYADAMAGCACEKFFARFMCEQKTRGRYCEGYWGKVPQCPQAGPPQDRGQ
jgi:hypothetical protein